AILDEAGFCIGHGSSFCAHASIQCKRPLAGRRCFSYTPGVEKWLRHASAPRANSTRYTRLHREAQAMKKEGHPDYHFINVVMTDGTEYQTRSTYGAEGDKLVLDIDSKSHPAWTGGDGKMLDRGGRVSRFKDKFKGFM
ncbi:50S ribosomal protein L31, partial [Hyphomonas sp.]